MRPYSFLNLTSGAGIENCTEMDDIPYLIQAVLCTKTAEIQKNSLSVIDQMQGLSAKFFGTVYVYAS